MHYICTGGCQGVSQTPGTCQAESCEKHNHQLVECDCQDSQHSQVMQQAENKQEGSN